MSFNVVGIIVCAAVYLSGVYFSESAWLTSMVTLLTYAIVVIFQRVHQPIVMVIDKEALAKQGGMHQ